MTWASTGYCKEHLSTITPRNVHAIRSAFSGASIVVCPNGCTRAQSAPLSVNVRSCAGQAKRQAPQRPSWRCAHWLGYSAILKPMGQVLKEHGWVAEPEVSWVYVEDKMGSPRARRKQEGRAALTLMNGDDAERCVHGRLSGAPSHLEVVWSIEGNGGIRQPRTPLHTAQERLLTTRRCDSCAGGPAGDPTRGVPTLQGVNSEMGLQLGLLIQEDLGEEDVELHLHNNRLSAWGTRTRTVSTARSAFIVQWVELLVLDHVLVVVHAPSYQETDSGAVKTACWLITERGMRVKLLDN
ncbi:hypothetical protein C8Q76DRAFT_698789 [Earliella scabrosa]|nr:hypothetical protein C8Q76DRAFT_698789 [Earliella scabrosa]